MIFDPSQYNIDFIFIFMFFFGIYYFCQMVCNLMHVMDKSKKESDRMVALFECWVMIMVSNLFMAPVIFKLIGVH